MQFYFLALAWGSLGILPLASLRQVGQAFYRFFGFLCVGMEMIAWIFQFERFHQFNSWMSESIIGFLIFTLVYTLLLKIHRRVWFWSAWALAMLTGGIILWIPWSACNQAWIFEVNGVSSAFLMGSGLLAMMLGHFYLVIPKLSIDPLKRYAACYIGFMIIKLGTLVLGGVGWNLLHSSILPQVMQREWMQEQFFLIFRILWGVLLPLALAYWIWGTVKIRSTQSATGILYAALVATLIGEALGWYLTFHLQIPV